MAFGSLLKEGTHVRLSGGCHNKTKYFSIFSSEGPETDLSEKDEDLVL